LKPGAAVFALAFLIRALHVWQLQRSPFSTVLLGDALSYDTWARIAGGDWPGADVFYQAPLYPYLLGAFYAVLGNDLLKEALRLNPALPEAFNNIGTAAVAAFQQALALQPDYPEAKANLDHANALQRQR
jgi:hypothetical protein